MLQGDEEPGLLHSSYTTRSGSGSASSDSMGDRRGGSCAKSKWHHAQLLQFPSPGKSGLCYQPQLPANPQAQAPAIEVAKLGPPQGGSNSQRHPIMGIKHGLSLTLTSGVLGRQDPVSDGTPGMAISTD